MRPNKKNKRTKTKSDLLIITGKNHKNLPQTKSVMWQVSWQNNDTNNMLTNFLREYFPFQKNYRPDSSLEPLPFQARGSRYLKSSVP